LSFLLGVAFTYLLLQPNGAVPKCPTAAAIKTEKETAPCNCDKAVAAAQKAAVRLATTTTAVSTTEKSKEKSFYSLGLKYGTDKVVGRLRLPGCLKDDKTCTRPSCVREECRPWCVGGCMLAHCSFCFIHVRFLLTLPVSLLCCSKII
jgi:hypothetical protein